MPEMRNSVSTVFHVRRTLASQQQAPSERCIAADQHGCSVYQFCTLHACAIGTETLCMPNCAGCLRTVAGINEYQFSRRFRLAWETEAELLAEIRKPFLRWSTPFL